MYQALVVYMGVSYRARMICAAAAAAAVVASSDSSNNSSSSSAEKPVHKVNSYLTIDAFCAKFSTMTIPEFLTVLWISARLSC